MFHFPIDSQTCQFLVLLDQCKTVEALSIELNKDPSVISRQLKKMAQDYQVLEKVEGRWVINELGKKIIRWSKAAAEEQSNIIHSKSILKIATTREFAARILIPHLGHFLNNDRYYYSILSSDQGIESLLLDGKAHFGFDCGRPNNPQIAYKKLIKESFVCVASPRYIKKHKIKNFSDLNPADCLKFSRTEISLAEQSEKQQSIQTLFNDIATQRSALVHDMGHGVIPYYAIREEIEEGKLQIIEGKKFPQEHYGIWWNRSLINQQHLRLIEEAQKWPANLEHFFIPTFENENRH